MELTNVARVVGRRWRWVAAGVVLALGGAALAAALATPVYVAQTLLFVSTPTLGTTSDLLSGSSFTQQRVQSYPRVVTSERVLEPVVEELDLPSTPAELAEVVSTDVPRESVLLEISVSDPDPERAAGVVNAVATSFITVVNELESPVDGDVASPVRITVIEPATVPDAPTGPSLPLVLAAALVVGVVLGTAAALLRARSDPLVHTEGDVGRLLGAPVLASLPRDAAATPVSLVADDPRHPSADAVRRLRTGLQLTSAAAPVRSLLVTSSTGGEGCSTTAAHLAVSIARTGSSVVLVDAHLRRPALGRLFGVPDDRGLATVLAGRSGVDAVVVPYGPVDGLALLPAGEVVGDPSDLVASSRLRTVLEVLEEQYDVIVVDGPPLQGSTDGVVLAAATRATLLVVAVGAVHRDDLTSAAAALRTTGSPVLGAVTTRPSGRVAEPRRPPQRQVSGSRAPDG